MRFKGHVGVGILFFGGFHYALSKYGYRVEQITEDSLIITDHIIYFFACFAGAIWPDVDLLLNDWQRHRQSTHSILLAAITTYIGLQTNDLIVFFCLGWWSHIIADMITGDVPILIWAERGVACMPMKYRIGVNDFDYFTQEMIKEIVNGITDIGGWIVYAALGLYLFWESDNVFTYIFRDFLFGGLIFDS